MTQALPKERTEEKRNNAGTKWIRPVVWGLVAVALLAPAVAMQFTDEVQWTLRDFVAAACMLIGAGAALEILFRVNHLAAYRFGALLAVFAALLLAWANAAVGLVGSGPNAANVGYGVLLGVAVVCACAVRFRPAGMARSMAVVAFGQVLVTVLAFAGGLVQPHEQRAVLAGNLVLALLWAASALLFRVSAR
jgi:hypothetical protein